MSPDGEFGGKTVQEVEKKVDTKVESSKPSVSPKEAMSLEGVIVNMPQVISLVPEDFILMILR